MEQVLTYQWMLVLVFGAGFLLFIPFAKNAEVFFCASSNKGKEPGFWLLSSSLVISWIFAKSIVNVTNLGFELGYWGALAYASYYLSFVIAGAVILKLRTKRGFSSIHQFLNSQFGKGALIIFSLLIGIRLFNEVWSNSMVIGSYFGAYGSSQYISSIIVFTLLTVGYTLKGGLRSSLITDAIQLIFLGVMIAVLLGIFWNNSSLSTTSISEVTSPTSNSSGILLTLAVLLQIWSYPFHDPVLTDRGFISAPKNMMKSFIAAAIIGFVIIFITGFIGIYAKETGVSDQPAFEISKLTGLSSLLLLNFIMITSAASTMDSAFSSFSKLMVKDVGWKWSINLVKSGRWMMVLIAVLGTIPIFLNPKILSATTVSGTMVMGLAPIFILNHKKANQWSFMLPVGTGIILGILYASDTFPDVLILTKAKYSVLFWVNLWGLMLCIMLYYLPIFWKKWNNK